MNRLSFARALWLVASLGVVLSRSDGGGNSGGNSNHHRDRGAFPFSNQTPHSSHEAVVHSYTFELTREHTDASSSSSVNFILSGEESSAKEHSAAKSKSKESELPSWAEHPSVSISEASPISFERHASPPPTYEVRAPHDNHLNDMRGGGGGGDGDGGGNNGDYVAVVSAETLYSQVPEHAAEWDSYRDSFLAAWREFMFEQREGEDNDDDDDDDDNNDGSCSMLSNAAISTSTRARVAMPVGGNDDGRSENRRVEPMRSERKRRRRQTKWGMANSGASINKVVGLRGGANLAPAQVRSEVFQRLLVSALVTLVYEACLGHTLEFIKN